MALEKAAERLSCFEGLATQERAATADAFAKPKSADDTVDAGPPVTMEEARAELGAEQVARRPAPADDSALSEEDKAKKTAKEQARQGLAFQVLRSVKDGEQRRIFYMSDGQVWREIEPGRIYFPRRGGFDVVINRGALNDYRLRVKGKGRFTRVVRLR